MQRQRWVEQLWLLNFRWETDDDADSYLWQYSVSLGLFYSTDEILTQALFCFAVSYCITLHHLQRVHLGRDVLQFTTVHLLYEFKKSIYRKNNAYCFSLWVWWWFQVFGFLLTWALVWFCPSLLLCLYVGIFLLLSFESLFGSFFVFWILFVGPGLVLLFWGLDWILAASIVSEIVSCYHRQTFWAVIRLF